jgi:hypothetical protein
MIKNSTLPVTAYSKADELLRIGSVAVARAQEESRQRGVPNVYSINGRLYYETTSGALSTTDPYSVGQDGTQLDDARERE